MHEDKSRLGVSWEKLTSSQPYLKTFLNNWRTFSQQLDCTQIQNKTALHHETQLSVSWLFGSLQLKNLSVFSSASAE